MKSAIDPSKMVPRRCLVCGGRLYHAATCRVVREEVAIDALIALRHAYAGAPLFVLCPCQLGFPGVLGCSHGWRSRGKSIAAVGVSGADTMTSADARRWTPPRPHTGPDRLTADGS